MFDHLIGLVLIGLGISNPLGGSVKGETTTRFALPTPPPSEHDGSDAGRFRYENHPDTRPTLKSAEAIKNLRTTTALRLKQRLNEVRAFNKSKLEKIHDTTKKTLAADLLVAINEVNARHTGQMTERITKMRSMLALLSSRATEAAGKGADVSAVTTAIGVATTALDQAASAVSVQSAKVYTIGTTSDTTLRSDVATVRLQLANDLKNTSEQIMSARSAVKDAIVALAHALGEGTTTP